MNVAELPPMTQEEYRMGLSHLSYSDLLFFRHGLSECARRGCHTDQMWKSPLLQAEINRRCQF